MAVEVKVEMDGNTITSDPVNADVDKKITLSALKSDGSAADGTWTKDGTTDPLTTTKTGMYELVAGKASAGKYEFIPKGPSDEQKSVTVKLHAAPEKLKWIKSFLGSAIAVFAGLILGRHANASLPRSHPRK
jgi:hypothetical protein